MEQKEFIGGNPDWFECKCGNTPHSSGFYPCHQNGVIREPDGDWKGIYVCFDCGNIIQWDTLEIIGQATYMAGLFNADYFDTLQLQFTSNRAIIDTTQ